MEAYPCNSFKCLLEALAMSPLGERSSYNSCNKLLYLVSQLVPNCMHRLRQG